MSWTVPSIRALAIALALACAGCGDEPCEEAAARLRECLAALDCNNTDPLDRPRCVSAAQQGEDALSRLEGVPCVSDVETLAEQVNRCDPDPGDFCDCF